MTPPSGPAGTPSTVSVRRIGYLAVQTEDVDRLAGCSTDVLGPALTEGDGPRAYLTTGPDHHAVAIGKGPAHGRAAINPAMLDH